MPKIGRVVPPDRGVGPKFGLYLPQMRMSYAAIEEQVRSAEAMRYHSVWFMDHLGAPERRDWDVFDPWTLMAALTRRTSTIRLGHLVLAGPLRHPAVLAKMAATVDVLSEGRLDLGLGWGSVDAELRDYGFGTDPPRVRAMKLAETIEILNRMFTGEPFSFRGRHFNLDNAQGRPVPAQASIPLHIGGGGPRLTMRLVERYADWWNCPSYAADRLEQLLPLAGRARVSIQHPIGLAPSRSHRDEVAAETERRFGAWGGLVVGTPSEVAAQLISEAHLGVELFICQFSDFGTDKTMRLFAREVVPAVRAELG